MAMKTMLSLVALVALTAVGARAWGPVSHATFNCGAYYPELSLSECLTTKRTMVTASDLPDSFAFGAFNVSGDADPSGWGCVGLSYVHDPLFGAHLLGFATANAANYSAGGAFEAVDFARGFMGHMLGDLVGFNPSGGILDSREAGHPTSAGYLYFPGLSYMAALDSYFVFNASVPAARLPVPDASTMGPDGQAFALLHDAMVSYHAVQPSFAVVPEPTIRQCINFWSSNMQYVFDRAGFYASSPDNSDFLVRELSWFAPRAGSGPGGAPTGPEVTEWLARQRYCSSTAVGTYYDLVSKGADPAAAFHKTATVVSGLYTSGACTFSGQRPLPAH